MKLNISDWVQGKTRNGELIQGFVESINVMQGIVTVYVVKSDNEAIINKSVAVREHWLKHAAATSEDDTIFKQNLIDMALATWDEAWFMELTEPMKSMQGDETSATGRSSLYPLPTNRLGQSA